MPRLFVAIDLPEPRRSELAAFSWPASPGLRLIPADQMHLTIHFLGEQELSPVQAVLKEVLFTSFRLQLMGGGMFSGRQGDRILWCGFRQSAELLSLHERTAVALQSIGFQPERRPYRPHLTLARAGAGVPDAVIDSFLTACADWQSPEFDVTSFRLYSSRLTPAGPIYRSELDVPLFQEMRVKEGEQDAAAP